MAPRLSTYRFFGMLLLGAFGFGAFLAAQRYHFQTINVDDGLPASSVLAMAQDRNGFLWFGHIDAATRYDGVECRPFRTPKTPYLIIFITFFQDRAGTLWAGTDGRGLYRFDGRDWLPAGNGSPAEAHIFCIAENARGGLCISTNKGLFVQEGQRWRPEVICPGPTPLVPYQLKNDPEGRLWAATDRGLWRRDAGGWRPAPGQPGAFARGLCTCLAFDSGGRLWVGGPQGVWRRTGERWEQVFRGDSGPDAMVMTMAFDRSGRVWCLASRSLICLEDGKTTEIGEKQGLPPGALTSLLVDREDQIWVGAFNSGAACLNNPAFVSWTRKDGLYGENVYTVYFPGGGAMFLGTDEGVARLENGRWDSWSLKELALVQSVSTFARDGRGRIWAAGVGGVRILQGNRWVSLPEYPDVMPKRFRVTSDSRGRIWVVSPPNRVSVFDGQTRTDYPLDALLGRQSFWAFFIDALDCPWVGTQDGRVFQLVKGRWQLAAFSVQLPTTNIYALCQDAAGRVWLGLRSLGAYVFQDGVLAAIHKENSQSYDAWFCLAALGERVAAGTTHGLILFEKDQIRTFSHRDGLASSELNVICRQPDDPDTAWAGTLCGLTRIDLRRLPRCDVAPPIHLLGVEIDGTALSLDTKAVLRHDRNNVIFRFAGVSLAAPDKVRYRYRLVGLDSAEQETDQRSVQYRNLPPGRYEFQVSASRSPGKWSERPARFAFTVLAPWWATGWAVLGFCLLAAGLLAFAYKLRVRALNRRQTILESEVADRTQEIAQANQELEVLNKNLIEQIHCRLKAEEELRRFNERLKNLDQMKTEFLNIASHEIRTPLTSVMGFAKLLQKKQEDLIELCLQSELAPNDALSPAKAGEKEGDDQARKRKKLIETVRNNTQIIVLEGERLTALINDLLDIAKMEAGKIAWRREVLAPADLFVNALAATSALFHPHGPERTLAVAEDVTPFRGDRTRLIQVLINLLSNAAKFTRSGQVACRVIREDGNVVFSVTDTGRGIAPEDQSRLFEKFVQVGQDPDGQRGTGLGLSICRQIVEYHNGRIWVESELGRGSTFSFSIPIVP